ncbi:MAG: hypothetical protein H6748_17155 [Spirochaetaceae bacterium]|nr:hypothetical protein [Myxococcales bacterium]MCB9725779.1 hypothetical protein [Spirochaetaceae bacterium]HPG24377.1 hypothetical protein [Myxococcota bacterium]
MTRTDPSARGPLVARRFDGCARELAARRIRVHLECDPVDEPPATGPAITALDALVRFVLDTTPDGCEVYVATRGDPGAPVASGSGEIVVRWQVAGERVADRGIVPIRPLPGDADRHATSRRARRVVALFEALAWELSLGSTPGGGELLARVRIGPSVHDG